MFAHKKLYDKLSAGFSNSQSRIMSEALVELVEQQNDKLAQHLDKVLAQFATKEDLHREINTQTWKFITAMGVGMSLLTTIFYCIAKFV